MNCLMSIEWKSVKKIYQPQAISNKIKSIGASFTVKNAVVSECILSDLNIWLEQSENENQAWKKKYVF